MTDNRIKQIADYNGISTILNKLTEECGELVTAIARFDNWGRVADSEAVIEEAVDVMIMLEQLKILWPEEYDRIREFKINRQLERMGVNNGKV